MLVYSKQSRKKIITIHPSTYYPETTAAGAWASTPVFSGAWSFAFCFRNARLVSWYSSCWDGVQLVSQTYLGYTNRFMCF